MSMSMVRPRARRSRRGRGRRRSACGHARAQAASGRPYPAARAPSAPSPPLKVPERESLPLTFADDRIRVARSTGRASPRHELARRSPSRVSDRNSVAWEADLKRIARRRFDLTAQRSSADPEQQGRSSASAWRKPLTARDLTPIHSLAERGRGEASERRNGSGVHDASATKSLRHAFGHALAYCRPQPRRAAAATQHLRAPIGPGSQRAIPRTVRIAPRRRVGTARLGSSGTASRSTSSVNNLRLHEAVSSAVVWVPLETREVPVLDCASLTVFKSPRVQPHQSLGQTSRRWRRQRPSRSRPPQARSASLVGNDDPAYRRLAAVIAANPAIAAPPRTTLPLPFRPVQEA